MSKSFQLALVWLFGSVVAVGLSLQMVAASFIDGQYLPVGHDAFYHARRILDAVQTGALYQFDARMHAPDGDWVTWPWAYDFSLAKLTSLVMQLTGIAEPVTALMHVPPLLAVLGVGLVVAICAALGLSLMPTVLATACFSLHAFTQYQFGVGALDHHGAEQIATLAALLFGVWWLKEPQEIGRALVLGLALGLVIGIHAGLFILQIPLLVALLIGWLRGESINPRAALSLVSGLLVGTLLILIPAETFWQPRFVIYYLSWLHFYVSLASATVILFISNVAFGKRASMQGLALLVALAIPLLAVFAFSAGFLSGNMTSISSIDEIRGPLRVAAEGAGLRRINQVYTLLVWAAPALAGMSLLLGLTERCADRRYFWLMSAFGLALLLSQLRLGSFGVTFLYAALLVLASDVIHRQARAQWASWAVVATALLVSYYPTLRYQLIGMRTPAMDQQFVSLRPIIPLLRDACRRDPGVVLAEPGDGHLIRYFTDCAVIANNFRLTPADTAKISEALQLIGMPWNDMRSRAPYVKYVVARLTPPVESENPVLYLQLLSQQELRPKGVESLVELSVTHPDGSTERFLGVYRVTGSNLEVGDMQELINPVPASSSDIANDGTSSPATPPL